MGFKMADREGKGGYARVWNVTKKEKYSEVRLSTSKKDKNSGKYKQDFNHNFVRFVGKAHRDISELNIPEKGMSIQILDGETTNEYNKEKDVTYTNYMVYDFTPAEQGGGNNNASQKSSAPAAQKTTAKHQPVEDDSDELPF